MTQEDKKLVLRDFCARVPYHPKGHVVNACNGTECDEWLTCATFTMLTNVRNNCRLYLRPMSSMTEEEKKEYERFSHLSIGFAPILMDWIYSHHLDCCGLIPKGLALEAPEGMYNIKKK